MQKTSPLGSSHIDEKSVLIAFLAMNTMLAIMTMLASKDFKAQQKKLSPVGLDLMITGSRV